MPIRAPAARAIVREILRAYDREVSEIEVSLAASLLIKAVERDEFAERAHEAERRLLVVGAPDSLGG